MGWRVVSSSLGGCQVLWGREGRLDRVGWLEGWPSIAFHGTDCTEARPWLCHVAQAELALLRLQGQLSVMAAQSVYDASMPRPSKEVVRGEILPSAWILQPLTVEGKEITRVIYLAQVTHSMRLAMQHACI